MTVQRPDGARSTSTDVTTRVTREDLIALSAVYQRVTRRADRLGGVGVVAGLGVGALLLWVAGFLGWPGFLAPWLFSLGWALALGAGAGTWLWQRRELTKYEFRCPACDCVVLPPTLRRSVASRVALAVAGGSCPGCGASLVGQQPDEDS